MPPRSKRKTARRLRVSQDNSDYGDSPSRPANKKRRLNGRTAVRPITPSSEPDNQAGDETNDESENLSEAELVEQVTASLAVADHEIVAAREFANAKRQEDTQKINAYAKLAGRDWTYFVNTQSVNIGRPPIPDERTGSVNGNGASSPASDMRDLVHVDIDLGPHKTVSRLHATIFYDAEFPDGGGWHTRVNSRNGLRVNNVLLRRGGRQQIISGTIIEISGTQMMFVTPGDPVQIDQYFTDKMRKQTAGDDSSLMAGLFSDKPELPPPAAGPGYQQLAPAPHPHLKQERASTPPPHRMDSGPQRAVFDTKTAVSPMYGRGMMMESTQQIDYSRDSAKDLKPPFSYATMIAQAIFSTDEEKMTLANIYSYIADKYAFYRHSQAGWQNSIRHNLSLNKAFQKVPRRTDEPGKGMKWMIAPENRQEYLKKAAKRHGGSAPSSPASSKEVNPNFRGPNGQNLGYDTSMVTSFSAKDSGLPHGGTRLNFQPPPVSSSISQFAPVPNLAPPNQTQQETTTPQRRRHDTGATLPESILDESPLPDRSRPTPHHQGPPIYTLPSSVPPPHRSPSNPTLSSSYLDTPFHPSQRSSMITPAPMRQNPRLVPPSTLVAPSKFMPESSPAGPGLFWKGIMGATPGMPVPDLSPVKVDEDDLHRRMNGRGSLDSEHDRQVMSSSPPPMDVMGSPSKPARSSQLPMTSSSARKDRDETRSRSATSARSPELKQVQYNTAPPLQLQHNLKALDDDDDGDGGFDLAKGFAPIARGMGSGRRFGL